MNKDKIIFAGDVHGDFSLLAIKIKNKKISDAFIIQVGDFGMGFFQEDDYPNALRSLHNTLKKSNCHMYVIRGNHDDPSFFNKRQTIGGYDNIELIPDYTVLTLLGKKILLVGGAVSIDRTERYHTSLPSWWEDEVFKFDEHFNYEKYDIVVTHSRPNQSGLFLTKQSIQYYIDRDLNLLADVADESEQHNKLYEKTKPKYWYFGHFHSPQTSIVDDTTFRCLDIVELYMHFD